MKKLNTTITYTLIILVMLSIPSLLIAQGPPDPGGEPTPIDGGLSLLIAGGVAYGAKRVRDARRGKGDKK